jgi:hypothetical protein
LVALNSDNRTLVGDVDGTHIDAARSGTQLACTSTVDALPPENPDPKVSIDTFVQSPRLSSSVLIKASQMVEIDVH